MYMKQQQTITPRILDTQWIFGEWLLMEEHEKIYEDFKL